MRDGDNWGRGTREEETNKNEKEDKNTTKQGAGEVYTDEVNSKNNSSRSVRKAWGSNRIFENLTWLTSNEAADYLRLPSVGALRVLVCKRRVPFHKLGRSLRFRKTELDRLLEISRNGGI